MKNNRRIGKILGISTMLGLTAFTAAGTTLYELGLARNGLIKWKPAKKHSNENLGKLPFDHNWVPNNCKEIYMTNSEEMLLHAYFKSCPNDSHRYAVMCHGYRSQARLNGTPANIMYDMGFGILGPDARGHGESEGNYVGMGWHERRDIIEWLKLLVALDPEAEILLYGISMGGATVMCTSGEPDLPSNVKAVIEDCGFSSTYEEFSHELSCMGIPKLLVKPMLEFSRAISYVRSGYDFKQGSALEQLAKSKTPTLFIHGGKDGFVPTYMLDKNYDACNAPKEKLIIEGATHGVSLFTEPERYWGTVKRFIDKWM